MITESMLSILSCPACRGGGLRARRDGGGALSCEACGTGFPVLQGIPDLIPHDRLGAGNWKTWRDHLEGFSSRRERRQRKPNPRQLRRWAEQLQAFVDFMDIPPGNVLDVGCGPGILRGGIEATPGASYIGVDPLPTADAASFPFVRALAEHLPFRDGSLSCIVVHSALDHFCDLRAFFEEARRLLAPGGRMFLEQMVHGTGGLPGLAKAAAHRLQDFRDGLRGDRGCDAPKHITEFSTGRLLDAVKPFFDVTDVREHNTNWLAPTRVFVALRRRAP
jgi:SAM-dependent methyltransferase